ncbi:MAG: rhodanese-like domain-containing protein [Planctomycetota bacterium]
MVYAALAIAILALVVALIAKSAASKPSQAVEDAKSEARRRDENLKEELGGEIAALRQMLAKVAAGEAISADMVLEGRLWREASTDEGKALVTAGARILDVRTPQETSRGIIPGALLIPVQELEQRWRELPKDGKPTLVYCAGGERSAHACEFLSRQGYGKLHNLSGGFMSWSGPTGKAG